MVNAAEMRMGLGDVSPRHPGVAPTVLSMLQSARRGLAEAADESAPGARYVTAHLAALRAAAAVVAARGESGSLRHRFRSEPSRLHAPGLELAHHGRSWLVKDSKENPAV